MTASVAYRFDRRSFFLAAASIVGVACMLMVQGARSQNGSLTDDIAAAIQRYESGNLRATRRILRDVIDAGMRSNALLEAQNYLVTEVEQTPLQQRLASLEQSFFESADIRDLVLRYGTISSFSIRLTEKFFADNFYH